MTIGTPSKDICFFCNEVIGSRVKFCNVAGDTFLYLPKSQHAHFECYIEYCARMAMKKEK